MGVRREPKTTQGETHSMPGKRTVLIFLCLALSGASSINIKPRKLAREEVKSKEDDPPITSILANNNIENNDSRPEPPEPIKHIPKGTNIEKGPQDAIRMPGTAWCGKGWRADSAKSMGGYAGADRCCRHHDLGCPISIEPGQTKYGLTNVRIHTVMHCSCDERFRSCLKMARTQAADIVGNLFFNVADIPCFVFSRNKVCTTRNWWGRCTTQHERHTAVWREPVTYTN